MLEEVLGYKADIVCLQEVDEKAFSEFLRPHLEAAGCVGGGGGRGEGSLVGR